MKVASRDLGPRVLAFTLDNGFLSAAASANMRRILDSLGIDHVLFWLPAQTMRPLYQFSMGIAFGSNTTKYSTAGCGSCISMVLASGRLLLQRTRDVGHLVLCGPVHSRRRRLQSAGQGDRSSQDRG